MSASRALLASIAFLIALAPLARGQRILEMPAGAAEVGVDFSGFWTGFGRAGAARDLGRRSWVKLPWSGSLIDPRLVGYSFSVRPTWSVRSSGTGPAVAFRQLDFEFGANLLARFPVSLRLGGGRSTGTSRGGSGSVSDFETANFSAALQVRARAFPGEVTYTRRSLDQTWRLAAVPTPLRRQDVLRTLRLAAQSSKTTLTIERTTLEDRTNGDGFAGWSALFGHALRWGKGSRLETNVDYTDRGGFLSYRRTAWQEGLHLQHTRGVSSDYFYRRAGSESNGAAARSESYGAGTAARLNRWVTVGVRGAAQATRVLDRRAAVRSVAPHVDFTAPLRGRTRLTGGLVLGFERRRLRGDTAGTTLVIDERHTVDPTLRFILDEPDADSATVVVRNLDRTLVYVAGVDYRIAPLGRQLEVQVLPGSRIQSGETVLASYVFRLPPDQAGNATTASYHAAIEMVGLSLRHRRSVRSSDPAGELEGLRLRGFNESSTELALTRHVPVGDWRVTAARRRRTAEGAGGYTIYEVHTSLALPPLPDAQAALGADWSITTSGPERVRALGLTALATWTPTAVLHVTAGLSAFSWQRAANDFERFLGQTIDVDWRFAAIETALHYEHQHRRLGIAGEVNRVSVRAVRRF